MNILKHQQKGSREGGVPTFWGAGNKWGRGYLGAVGCGAYMTGEGGCVVWWVCWGLWLKTGGVSSTWGFGIR